MRSRPKIIARPGRRGPRGSSVLRNAGSEQDRKQIVILPVSLPAISTQVHQSLNLKSENLEGTVKSRCTLLLALFLFVSISLAQNVFLVRTDVYHILFAKAALGKAVEEGDFRKTQAPNRPMPGHHLVLRHQFG
jgi:hypothetical protein